MMIDLSTDTNNNEFESILPLVNVVFLLLIFFMLAGAFTTPDLFKVTPPIAQTDNKTSAKKGIILVNKDGTIAFQNKTLTTQQLGSIIKSKQENLKGLKIKADGSTDSIRVIKIIDVLQNHGVKQIELLTMVE